MQEEEILEVDGEEEESSITINEDVIVPAFGSELWHDYVMRQFKADELMDGAPTCDGCRRVVEQLIGPILQSQINFIQPANKDNGGTSTVCIRITISVNNESHPLCGNVQIIDDVADVNRDNTDAPYYKYPSATALTRAEGRALRKALRLNKVYVAEEVSKVAEENDSQIDWEPDEPITDSQIQVIDMMCGAERLNISVMEFVNSGRRVYSSIMEVGKSTAQKMIQVLNKIQQKKDTIPKGVGPYVTNWRK